MKNFPLCSIIVLNYFGERIIASTIDSLMRMDYPEDRFEVIIVDNNSQDKSRDIINALAQKHENIRPVLLDKNLGFSKGNNVGIKTSKGEYVALLNNDCIVSKNWLRELVRTALENSDTFAVSSKIKLYPKYYYFKFTYNDDLLQTDARLIDSNLFKLERSRKLNIINKGDYSVTEIPYSPDDRVITVRMAFEINHKKSVRYLEEQAMMLVVLDNEGIVDKLKRVINKNQLIIEVKFDVSKFSSKDVYERVQNAGIVVFQDGSGRDIGAKIVEQRQYYEYDFGQFSKEQEVYAACGAAVLYDKKILDKIGYLDESFFMYYEDVEISERARLRGYKVYYCPKAVVRHLHAFSSREWSNFFIYQAEKGRLLHTFFHFPLRVFIKEYLMIYLKIGSVGIGIVKGSSDIRRLLKFIKGIFAYFYGSAGGGGDSKIDIGKIIQYMKILFYFPSHLPVLVIDRYKKHFRISQKAVSNNYQDIIKGKWYFNQ